MLRARPGRAASGAMVQRPVDPESYCTDPITVEYPDGQIDRSSILKVSKKGKVKVLEFHPVQPWVALASVSDSIAIWDWSTQQVSTRATI